VHVWWENVGSTGGGHRNHESLSAGLSVTGLVTGDIAVLTLVFLVAVVFCSFSVVVVVWFQRNLASPWVGFLAALFLVLIARVEPFLAAAG
jgi:succinate dehydrogenase hydrophobic anchor subunit